MYSRASVKLNTNNNKETELASAERLRGVYTNKNREREPKISTWNQDEKHDCIDVILWHSEENRSIASQHININALH